MFRSLLIKLAMLGATVALVLWMGWPADKPEPELEARLESPPVVQAPAPSATSDQPAPAAHQDKPPARPSLVDLNRATAQELEDLPGVGPVLAQRIVQWREAHGRFHSLEDLNAVKGIGDKKLSRLRTMVMVGKPQPKPASASAPLPREAAR